jgi:hypothetical protein
MVSAACVCVCVCVCVLKKNLFRLRWAPWHLLRVWVCAVCKYMCMNMFVRARRFLYMRVREHVRVQPHVRVCMR